MRRAESLPVSTDAMSIYRRAYQLLKTIGPLRKLVRALREVLGRYRVPAWYLDGSLRADGIRISTVFAGPLESKNYFAHLLFVDNSTERFLGTNWVWNVLRNGVRLGSDLVITHELSDTRPRRGSSGYCVPCWIGTEADVSRAVDLCRKSENIKSDLRRSKRSRMTYDITRDPQTIADFYNAMYLPYVHRVHGNRTMSTPWEELEPELDRSELMLLERDGEAIAGNLMVDLGNQRMRARALGVKDGDPQYVKQGALAALYHYEVDYLSRRGYEKIHYGASRPFLKDGALGFKKKYGARIVDRDTRVFRIRVLRYSMGVKSFLRNNPFISESNGHYYANFFIERSTDIDGPNLQSDIDRYGIAGTAAVRVYDLENASGPLDVDPRPAEPTFVEICRSDASFTSTT